MTKHNKLSGMSQSLSGVSAVDPGLHPVSLTSGVSAVDPGLHPVSLGQLPCGGELEVFMEEVFLRLQEKVKVPETGGHKRRSKSQRHRETPSNMYRCR